MGMTLKRIAAIGLLAGSIGATSAWAAAGNSISIRVARHASVGQRLVVTFSGRDTSPPNVVGTFVAAVLEPPLTDGGSRCRGDLGTTEQNHPASKELFFQKLLDTHHTGHYSVKERMPRFSARGRWTVCAWQFNNDGRTSTDVPASHAQVHIMVVRSH
jgi:hypothetical protein